jgi:TrmH family RNA methyltransferase
MARISGPANTQIKQFRALTKRRERERTGLFLIEGIPMVADAIRLGASVKLLLHSPDPLTSALGHDLLAQQRRRGTPCLELAAKVFTSVVSGVSLKFGPHGLGAVVHQRWKPLAPILPGDRRCWVALDSVQDPGNLGTIMRTCDAAGAVGIILLGQTTDPYDPSAVRASLGTIFSTTLIRSTFEELAAWSRRYGCRLIGTSGAAHYDYRSASYASPVVLLMGSEHRGLPSEQQALCDAVVRIPMLGHAESLNLAVATGVMLYELLDRQAIVAAHG